ncbi:MAG: mechanosensitive ion channel family protein [Bacilli bacterium]|nr:mechanosensitive ion channel family protein [Bacilli bacterium]
MKLKIFKKPETKQDYFEMIMKIIGLTIALVYFIFLIFGQFIFGETSQFYLSLNIFSGIGNPIVAVKIISYIIFIIAISITLRIILNFISQFLKKGAAVLKLLASMIKYIAAIVLIFLVLEAFRVDTVTLLVSAGVVSLIIGLGAQSLIGDVIAGLFIVFEGVFEIGDIVVVDDFRGTVKEIGVRTTQIEDWGGNIKVMNNSDIRSLINMTSKLSVAVVQAGIDYGESLERVELVIKNNLERMKTNIPAITDGPFYIGVSDLGDSGVYLKFIANCKEQNRFQVERDLMRELKLIFDENDINIPFNQVTINQPKVYMSSSTKNKKEAKKFLDEQIDQAKDYGAQPNNNKD